MSHHHYRARMTTSSAFFVGLAAALAGGPTSAEAWRMLIQIISRPAGPVLTTREVAAVLGVHPSRISRQVGGGRLRRLATAEPAGPRPARFAPAEIWRFVVERRGADWARRSPPAEY